LIDRGVVVILLILVAAAFYGVDMDVGHCNTLRSDSLGKLFRLQLVIEYLLGRIGEIAYDE
jgi:hypothetical protein